MADQTPPPSPVRASPRKKRRVTTTPPPMDVAVHDINIDWSSPAWDSPGHVDLCWRVLYGTDFPWRYFARAGLEYLTCPDTGKPDFSRTLLYEHLYVAQHGKRPPWGEWFGRDWTK